MKAFPGRPYTLEQVLVCTYCEIAVNGWTSSKTAEAASAGRVGILISTKEKVRLLLQTDLENGKVARKDLMTEAKTLGLDLFGDSVKKEVQTIIEWAKNLTNNAPLPGTRAAAAVSDYEAVVSLMARSGIVEVNKLGFAVSIISSYRNHADRQHNSKYVGTVYSEITADVTIKKITASKGSGSWWLIFTTDNDGNVIKWFATKSPEFKVGDTINITGRVLMHEDWQGFKSTKLGVAANIAHKGQALAHQVQSRLARLLTDATV